MKIGKKHPMGIRGLCVVVLAVVGLVACTTLSKFSGSWDLTSPRGENTVVVISQLQKNEYYLNAGTHPVSGVYTYKNDLLTMTKPDNPRMDGFVWRFDEDASFVLIRAPEVELSGEKLVSSRLVGPQG
jgi:hypothetical protein